MRILVFGAGALGSVFAGFLSKQNEVAIVAREQHAKAIKQRGLRVSGIWGKHVFKGIETFSSAQEAKKLAPFDLVLITTKSYDTLEAAKSVLPLINGESIVASVQNGIGNEEAIASIVGSGRTAGGMAIFGALLVEPGHVKVTVYASECLFGMLDGNEAKAKRLAALVSASGIPALPTDDVIREKWMKAFYNIALNPLSAILRCRYGALGEREETKAVMREMLREAFDVAQANGINLKFKSHEDYFDYLLQKQLPPTAEHRSSMLQDIERGKRTEIDYLNGAVVKLGKQLGIPAPVNETMVNLVKALESQSAMSRD